MRNKDKRYRITFLKLVAKEKRTHTQFFLHSLPFFLLMSMEIQVKFSENSMKSKEATERS